MVDKVVKCPHCAEAIKAEAKVCKHCHREMDAADRAAIEAQLMRPKGLGAGQIGCLVLIGFFVLVMALGSAGDKAAPGAGPSDAASGAAAIAATPDAETKDKAAGFDCLSSWDGSSAPLVESVKASLRDPDSFKHVETRIGPNKNGKHKLFMQYRARNGFGGMNVGYATAEVDHDTCDVTNVKMADN